MLTGWSPLLAYPPVHKVAASGRIPCVIQHKAQSHHLEFLPPSVKSWMERISPVIGQTIPLTLLHPITWKSPCSLAYEWRWFPKKVAPESVNYREKQDRNTLKKMIRPSIVPPSLLPHSFSLLSLEEATGPWKWYMAQRPGSCHGLRGWWQGQKPRGCRHHQELGYMRGVANILRPIRAKWI